MKSIRFTQAWGAWSALAVSVVLLVPGCAERSTPTSPTDDVASGLALKSKHKIKSERFGSRIDNPYFPLIPGTVFTYEGTTDGEDELIRTTVTHRTERIMGVNTTVVLDSAYVNGSLVEATEDYYAQDRAGNVWYFGEDTKEFDEEGNVVSTEGTWRAGVDDAEPGIIMKADPEVGDEYAQENAPDVAEDQAKVLSVDESVEVPYGQFSSVLQTEESTPLEPGAIEHKFYARNVGFVMSESVSGGNEVVELVQVSRFGESRRGGGHIGKRGGKDDDDDDKNDRKHGRKHFRR
jgi:hypothetical protein